MKTSKSEQSLSSLNKESYVNSMATPININTCDEDMLAALKPDLKKEDIKKLIFARGDEGFKKMEELFLSKKEYRAKILGMEQNYNLEKKIFLQIIKIMKIKLQLLMDLAC